MQEGSYERGPWLLLIMGYFLLAFGYMYRGATAPDGDWSDPRGIVYLLALFIAPPMILLWVRATLVRYQASLTIHTFAWLMGAAALFFLANGLGLFAPAS